MKRCLVFALVAMGMVACSSSSDSKKSTPQAPARTAEHKPTECPSGIEGVYLMQGGSGATITIRRNSGNLEVLASTGDSIIVDGRVTGGKHGSTTAICTAGIIDFRTTNTDGSIDVESIEKVGTDIQIHTTDNGAPIIVSANRIADAPAVGQNDQNKGAIDPITCNTGFQFSYDYDVNGCKTGKHTLCSKEEACAALMDDSLNNGCAHSERVDQFNKMCN